MAEAAAKDDEPLTEGVLDADCVAGSGCRVLSLANLGAPEAAGAGCAATEPAAGAGEAPGCAVGTAPLAWSAAAGRAAATPNAVIAGPAVAEALTGFASGAPLARYRGAGFASGDGAACAAGGGATEPVALTLSMRPVGAAACPVTEDDGRVSLRLGVEVLSV
ncbi:hypothetical protein Bsp3421_004950 [Burkholderia sp. FERM BP-3421]|uniref:hypothetical protein n=1 Tax=Burkholderia sp. FERM BP-3421 TaxID=1494466 RepID=UPI002799F62D|nr:hypothetical protein Bsp3421_004950 [Burkholderia sp. FERM BP-3421]